MKTPIRTPKDMAIIFYNDGNDLFLPIAEYKKIEDALWQDIKELRGALEFYGNLANWETHLKPPTRQNSSWTKVNGPIGKDLGEVARVALLKSKERFGE